MTIMTINSTAISDTCQEKYSSFVRCSWNKEGMNIHCTVSGQWRYPSDTTKGQEIHSFAVDKISWVLIFMGKGDPWKYNYHQRKHLCIYYGIYFNEVIWCDYTNIGYRGHQCREVISSQPIHWNDCKVSLNKITNHFNELKNINNSYWFP